MSKRLEMIREMLTQKPDDSFLLYGLANEYKNLGDLTKALETYRRLMELHPDYVAAYYQCGQAYEQAGNLEDAAKTYDLGIDAARRVGDGHALSELQAARDILG
jgi:tetratricopeptide (TPR) repeat protein